MAAVTLSTIYHLAVLIFCYEVVSSYKGNYEDDLPGISRKCLQCICDVESNCNRKMRCRNDQGSLSCGPFQIKKVFWIDCYKPGYTYKQCTRDYRCSIHCIQVYMNRYRSLMGPNPNCMTYARTHNGGPYGSTKNSTLGYWEKIKAAGCDENS